MSTMTAKEIIERLQKADPDAEVCVWDGNWNFWVRDVKVSRNKGAVQIVSDKTGPDDPGR